MPQWKILITDGLEKTGLAILREGALVEERPNITPEELLQVVPIYNALVVRGRTKVNAAVISAGKQLKVIGRAGVGVDNIDLQAAKSCGVVVVNAPLSTTQAVAEHTMALLLALSRSIPQADAGMKSGRWLKKELEGVEIHGKILGIIGLGNIGSKVAGLAGALGMKPVSYDPQLTDDQIRQRGAEPLDLPDLFDRSDFITIHVPLTPQTRGMIDGNAISRMKPGVRLVCAARGGVIDEAALVDALETGQVAGAALDVFGQEPPGLTALVTHPNVIATPHIAAQTSEAQARAAQDIASEVIRALRGEPLRWKVA